jgi:hypothetical protein
MKRTALPSIPLALLATISAVGCDSGPHAVLAYIEKPVVALELRDGHARLSGSFDLALTTSRATDDSEDDVWLHRLEFVSIDGAPVAPVVEVGSPVSFPVHYAGPDARRVPMTFVAMSTAPADDALGWLDSVTSYRLLGIHGETYAAPDDDLRPIAGVDDFCVVVEGMEVPCGL